MEGRCGGVGGDDRISIGRDGAMKGEIYGDIDCGNGSKEGGGGGGVIGDGNEGSIKLTEGGGPSKGGIQGGAVNGIDRDRKSVDQSHLETKWD